MQYAIALCLVSVFSNVYAWIAGGAYLSSWFPRKKGLALGWATMGNNLGFEQSKAIGTMTVCALIGVVGSYLWGVLDQKLTTRVATAIYGIWYAVAVLLNLIPNMVTIYISIFMLGVAIGGNANWPVSLVTTTFGHRNFAKVYSLINPAISIIRMLSFVVLAISLTLTGSYSAAYVAFVILAVVAAALIYFVNDKQYADPDEAAPAAPEAQTLNTGETT